MNLLSQVKIDESFGSPFGRGGKEISDLVSIILNGGMAIAGILILFLLLFGGFSVIAGAGSANTEQSERGKKAITSAVVGFILVFGAYWVIRLIEVIVGVNFITQPSI